MSPINKGKNMKPILAIAILTLSIQSMAALVEVKALDQVTLASNGICQIRQSSTVLKDGVEIAKSFHRFVADPGGDLSFLDDEAGKLVGVNKGQYQADVARIKAVCGAGWTKAVKDKFQADKIVRKMPGT
jgi:hypothetical protein